jgi:hypothetical protein
MLQIITPLDIKGYETLRRNGHKNNDNIVYAPLRIRAFYIGEDHISNIRDLGQQLHVPKDVLINKLNLISKISKISGDELRNRSLEELKTMVKEYTAESSNIIERLNKKDEWLKNLNEVENLIYDYYHELFGIGLTEKEREDNPDYLTCPDTLKPKKMETDKIFIWVSYHPTEIQRLNFYAEYYPDNHYLTKVLN